VIRENDELHFVFEYADGNLYQKIREQNNVPFPIDCVKRYTYDLLQGLAFMHKHGFFHRDLKPENLLLVNGIIKIADFGLARETRSLPPYTEYVSTRWYRAPEVLLRSTSYSSPIDLWAVGTIIAEIITLEPLFPGSTEIDEIYKIAYICGPPLPEANEVFDMHTHLGYQNEKQGRNRSELCGGGVWSDGLKLATQMNFKFQPGNPIPIANILRTAPDEVVQLVADMLLYDPQQRPTASEALKHPWFEDLSSPVNLKMTTPPQNHHRSLLTPTETSKNIKVDTHQHFFDASNSVSSDASIFLSKPQIVQRRSIEGNIMPPSQRQSFNDYKESQPSPIKTSPFKYPDSDMLRKPVY
jgi:serine/threonine protein kinase